MPTKLNITAAHGTLAAALGIVVALAGCATPKLAQKTATQPAEKLAPSPGHMVQRVRQEPSHIEGQTNWIIETDAPRIPKIEGLELDLPPHIEYRLSRAFDLAQRGATYSANAEFREVLTLCALDLDSRQGVTTHRDALQQAFVALVESDEISTHRIDWQNESDVRLITAGHSTPVLHAGVPPGADSVKVVQLYYSFAEERFALATQGMPAASLAYYGLARTYVQPGARHVHAAGKAAMLHRVALKTAPQNVLSANELGVLLAEHGHLNDAEALFKQCVATDASPEAWQNLATVYARKGDHRASHDAMAASRQLASAKKSAVPSTIVIADDTGVATQTQLAAVDPAKTSTGDTEDNEQRERLWSRLDVSKKLPNVFYR